MIDYDGTKGLFVKWSGHYSERQAVLDDMAAAGYRVDEDLDFLERQGFIIFAPE